MGKFTDERITCEKKVFDLILEQPMIKVSDMTKVSQGAGANANLINETDKKCLTDVMIALVPVFCVMAAALFVICYFLMRNFGNSQNLKVQTTSDLNEEETSNLNEKEIEELKLELAELEKKYESCEAEVRSKDLCVGAQKLKTELDSFNELDIITENLEDMIAGLNDVEDVGNMLALARKAFKEVSGNIIRIGEKYQNNFVPPYKKMQTDIGECMLRYKDELDKISKNELSENIPDFAARKIKLQRKNHGISCAIKHNVDIAELIDHNKDLARLQFNEIVKSITEFVLQKTNADNLLKSIDEMRASMLHNIPDGVNKRAVEKEIGILSVKTMDLFYTVDESVEEFDVLRDEIIYCSDVIDEKRKKMSEILESNWEVNLKLSGKQQNLKMRLQALNDNRKAMEMRLTAYIESSASLYRDLKGKKKFAIGCQQKIRELVLSFGIDTDELDTCDPTWAIDESNRWCGCYSVLRDLKVTILPEINRRFGERKALINFINGIYPAEAVKKLSKIQVKIKKMEENLQEQIAEAEARFKAKQKFDEDNKSKQPPNESDLYMVKSTGKPYRPKQDDSQNEGPMKSLMNRFIALLEDCVRNCDLKRKLKKFKKVFHSLESPFSPISSTFFTPSVLFLAKIKKLYGCEQSAEKLSTILSQAKAKCDSKSKHLDAIREIFVLEIVVPLVNIKENFEQCASKLEEISKNELSKKIDKFEFHKDALKQQSAELKAALGIIADVDALIKDSEDCAWRVVDFMKIKALISSVSSEVGRGAPIFFSAGESNRKIINDTVAEWNELRLEISKVLDGVAICVDDIKSLDGVTEKLKTLEILKSDVKTKFKKINRKLASIKIMREDHVCNSQNKIMLDRQKLIAICKQELIAVCKQVISEFVQKYNYCEEQIVRQFSLCGIYELKKEYKRVSLTAEQKFIVACDQFIPINGAKWDAGSLLFVGFRSISKRH